MGVIRGNMVSTFLQAVKRLLVYSEGEEPLKSPFFEGEATKLIFDHIRNITLAAIVSQVGLVALKLDATSWAYFIARGLGSIFMLLAFCLLTLNLFHGEYLLRHSPHFSILRRPRLFPLVEKVYWVLYVCLAFPALTFSIVLALS